MRIAAHQTHARSKRCKYSGMQHCQHKTRLLQLLTVRYISQEHSEASKSAKHTSTCSRWHQEIRPHQACAAGTSLAASHSARSIQSRTDHAQSAEHRPTSIPQQPCQRVQAITPSSLGVQAAALKTNGTRFRDRKSVV